MKVRTWLTATALVFGAFGGIAADAPEGCYVVDEADPATTDDDVFACEQQTYFHAAETKFSNLGTIAPDAHGLPSWDENPPAGSVQGGNGAGFLSNSTIYQGNGGSEGSAVFEGTFTGPLDVMDVDLHLLGPVPITADAYNVRVEIDGGDAFVNAGEVTIVPQEEPNATGAAQRLDFAITNIYDTLKRWGTVDGEHTIRIEVEPTYLVNDTAVFVFDTTEVPGGITFNPVDGVDDVPTISA